jgi:hypothetical protein
MLIVAAALVFWYGCVHKSADGAALLLRIALAACFAVVLAACGFSLGYGVCFAYHHIQLVWLP